MNSKEPKQQQERRQYRTKNSYSDGFPTSQARSSTVIYLILRIIDKYQSRGRGASITNIVYGAYRTSRWKILRQLIDDLLLCNIIEFKIGGEGDYHPHSSVNTKHYFLTQKGRYLLKLYTKYLNMIPQLSPQDDEV